MKLICLTLILLYGIQISFGQEKQCKNLGQYCQYHSECCSNNCLTYSYKCVRNRTEQSNADNQIQLQTEMRTQSANNIEELVDRFGGDDKNNDSTEEMRMETMRVQTEETPNACYANGRSCMNSRQCCSSECSKITNICLETSESATASQKPMVNSATSPPGCLVVGQKCYNAGHNECCPPLRCHGYYHHCVT